MINENSFVLWFEELSIDNVNIVGGKNASLGEMYSKLTKKGVKIPNGFAITAHAYRYLLEKTKAKQEIKKILSDLDTNNLNNLQKRGKKVRELIRNLKFPEELETEIYKYYDKLCKKEGFDVDVAVRSSATAEDLPDASFAGQQETYLNIKRHDLILACKNCFASLFTDRAISYREEKGFDHFSIALSIGVQRMVRSDKAASGVMFSIDTETGFKDVAFITGAYGLGENVVQGAVNPDEFYVFKPTLKLGKRPIISKELGSKDIKMIYSDHKGQTTKNIPVEKSLRDKFCINDDEILQLAKWATQIEEYYSKKRGKYTPMDMEWAKDGITGELFIVQARPETVHSQKDKTKLKEYNLVEKGKVILEGHSVGSLIGQGQVCIIKDVQDINKFKEGQVLVTEMTDPDWEPIMKKAAAIITNKGGRTCHAAIISRELGIPCIVGTINGTEVLSNKGKVTVDCSKGDKGFVYKGIVEYKITETNLEKVPKTKTKIMMNLANPDIAFAMSFIPNDGVGLAREEFIINSYIKVHPLALIHFNKIKDNETKNKIINLTKGYKNKSDYFIDKLSQGIGKIAAAFYPKKVILRMSDFKSNEYANLIGGKYFEPIENNPMIGWRGASRYYSGNYVEGFDLECKAIKKVREEFGLENLEIMIPFCRTISEAKNVIKRLKENGLKQGVKGLKVIGMCEIPANVILADEFLDIFDGFSIGTNDLTQLTLGLDRDSEIVSSIYDERNEAVKKLVASVIKTANKKKKYIGICGQAPSDYLEFAKFVVEEGIQTMSLNPDTVLKTTIAIAKLESKLKSKKTRKK